MKTLIVYTTKHKTVAKCVKLLSSQLLREVVICNLQEDELENIDCFQNVILGGSIYMGHIQRQMKNFIKQNREELKNKNLGLFICGIRTGKLALNELMTVFPQELINQAVTKKYFGGEIVYRELSWFERLIIKMVRKKDKDFPDLDENNNVSMIDEESIREFARDMNRLKDKG